RGLADPERGRLSGDDPVRPGGPPPHLGPDPRGADRPGVRAVEEAPLGAGPPRAAGGAGADQRHDRAPAPDLELVLPRPPPVRPGPGHAGRARGSPPRARTG